MTITKEWLDYYKGSSNIFVETGTFHGDTTQLALDCGYDAVFSIECNDKFYNECTERFKNDKNVTLVHGDSSEEISKIIDDIDSKITFWLDAHFMWMDPDQDVSKYPDGGNVPLIAELQQIKNHKIKNHTILIDDIPHLNDLDPRGNRGEFPPTGTVETQMENLMDFIETINPDYEFELVEVPTVGQFLACIIKE